MDGHWIYGIAYCNCSTLRHALRTYSGLHTNDSLRTWPDEMYHRCLVLSIYERQTPALSRPPSCCPTSLFITSYRPCIIRFYFGLPYLLHRDICMHDIYPTDLLPFSHTISSSNSMPSTQSCHSTSASYLFSLWLEYTSWKPRLRFALLRSHPIETERF